jgi:hypothetical protein
VTLPFGAEYVEVKEGTRDVLISGNLSSTCQRMRR